MKNRYKIISFVLVLILLLSAACTVSAYTYTYHPAQYGISQKYKLEFVLADGGSEEGCNDCQYINMLEYNAEGSVTSDEATPDYILAFCSWNSAYIFYTEVIGDYVVVSNNSNVPYGIGLYIFAPKDNKVYTLKEAWEAHLPRIEEVLNLVGDRIGDVNRDDVVNVKDVTLIQKAIADIEEIENDGIPYLTYVEGNPRYISDFDCDGQRTIKDATAIQKYIAGLNTN